MSEQFLNVQMASFDLEKNWFIHFFAMLSITLQTVWCTEDFDSDISRDYLTKTCPSYTGCSGGFFWGAELCCIKCSCNSTCVDTHSCCPESQYASLSPRPYRSDDPRLVCRNTVFIGNPINIYFNPEYEFIDTCPDTSNDQILEEFCERMELTNRSGIVADNTPVLDKSTGISYGNMYCAQCNNIDVANLEAWQPKLVCKIKFDLRAESFGQENGLERLIEYNRCDVSFEPPESFNDVKPCFADVIEACNITGNWTTYNQLDEYHCQNLDLLYVSIHDYGRKYKNIFCAICNGEYVYAKQVMMCPFRANRNTLTMTLLLDFTIGEIGIQTSQSELRHASRDQCPPSFRYDPLMGECRPLYCSLPYHVDMITSTCKLFHRYIENGHLVHSFKLVFKTLVNIREAQNIAEIFHTRVTDDPGVSICSICVFYQTVLTEDKYYMHNTTPSNLNVSSIYLSVYSFMSKVNPSEEYDLYTQRFYHHLDHENVVPLDSQYFDPVMLLGDGHEDELELIRLDYEEGFTFNFDGAPSHYIFTNPYDSTMIIGHIANFGSGRCKPRVHDQDFLMCTAFLYEKANLFNRKQDGLMIEFEGSSLVFNFSEFKSVNKTTVRICSDSVIKKVQVVSSGILFSFDCFALGFVLILIYFIFNFVSE